MIFSSPTFLFLFLPAVFLLQLLFLRSIKAGNFLLLAASLVFYAWGEPVYVILMILTTLVNYIAARCMEGGGPKKKLALIFAIIWSLGTLIVFKYTDFLVSSINGILNTGIPLPGIALPVGISFFTFQAMSYLIDVYRGEARAGKSYLDILLYISLFPQLIAGPIVKYHDIDEQIHNRSITVERTARGLRRFCFGLAKKVLIANTLASVADGVYALSPDLLIAPTAWLGALAYLMQIYFDFSGYSDMAIGLGMAFGFDFKENFDYPYTARSMQDFWRRWHISLSTWFKLYVYIPLGGNRKGKARTGINKLIVFLLTGLWHGASWSFALWGLFHGLFLMLESYGVFKPQKWPVLLRRVYVLLAVTLGFVLFRAETLAQAGLMMGNMFTGFSFTPEALAVWMRLLSPIVLFTLPVAAISATPFLHKRGLLYMDRQPAREWLLYVPAALLLVLCALNLSTAAYNPFIYFRF